MARPKKDLDKKPSRELLLEAATELIRTNGYASTTVDDLCTKAGVSKGTFFHNFSSKEELAVAAAKRWSDMTSEFFRTARSSSTRATAGQPPWATRAGSPSSAPTNTCAASWRAAPWPRTDESRHLARRPG